MRTGRRAFLQTAAAALLPAFSLPRIYSLRQARAMIAKGELGSVNFCRVPAPGWLADVRFVLGNCGGCVTAVEPTASGVEFLGSRATLVLDPNGYRLFGPAAAL